jgi:hypothetical protein
LVEKALAEKDVGMTSAAERAPEMVSRPMCCREKATTGRL